MWIALYTHFIVRKALSPHIQHIMFSPKPLNYAKYVLISCSLFALAFGAMLVRYHFTNESFEPPKEWMENLNAKCGTQIHINRVFHHRVLVYGGYVILILGSYLGLLAHKYFYNTFDQ